MIFRTKLWIDVKQGEDEGEFLIFLLSEESYEADNVVEQEWNQHRCGHLWVIGERTDILIIFIIGTVSIWAIWVIPTLLIIITFRMPIRTILTRLSSPVQFVDEIDVSESVEGWQYDVQSHDDQDCLHLHRCLWKIRYRVRKTPPVLASITS